MKRSHCIKKTVHQETEVQVLQRKHQIVIPRKLQSSCLCLMHDQMGHPGRERTLETIRLSYSWVGMNDDIQQYVKNCRFCKLRKVDNFRAKIPIQEYHRMSRPFDRVHADLAGPFQITERLNKYILIIKDALTKYTILVPLPGQKLLGENIASPLLAK